MAEPLKGSSSFLQIPHDMILQLSNSYLLADAQPLSLPELRKQNLEREIQDSHPVLEASIRGLLKESSERFKGWTSMLAPPHTELSCKKVRGAKGSLRAALGTSDVAPGPPLDYVSR